MPADLESIRTSAGYYLRAHSKIHPGEASLIFHALADVAADVQRLREAVFPTEPPAPPTPDRDIERSELLDFIRIELALEFISAADVRRVEAILERAERGEHRRSGR